MSAKEHSDQEGEGPVPKPRKGKFLLLVSGIMAVLVLALGGLAFSGMLPFGGGHHKSATSRAVKEAEGPHPPIFIDVPEMVVNLDAGPRRETFAKVVCRIEVPTAKDGATVTAAMPRVIDMLQTYLRAMRPEELGSEAGLYRLREAFLARASIAVPDAHLDDVLFAELIVQ